MPLVMIVPNTAVPRVAPKERESCVVEVATPRSSREVAFCTTSV